MDIIYKHVRNEEEAHEMVNEIGNQHVFMLDVELNKLKITKADYKTKGIIKSCTIKFTTGEQGDIVEHWYEIAEDVLGLLKEFFETNQFETYYGRMTSIAFRTLDIKLNIARDYCTEEGRLKIKGIIEKDGRLSGIQRIEACKITNDSGHRNGLLETEYGLGLYFGVGIDTDKLQQLIYNEQQYKACKEKELNNYLGDINFHYTREVISAFKEKLGIELTGVSNSKIREAMNNCEENTDAYNALMTFTEYKRASQSVQRITPITKKIENETAYIGEQGWALNKRETEYIVNNRVAKPAKKYTLIQISTERAAVFNMMQRISKVDQRLTDWFVYVASKAFEVEESDVTNEQRIAARSVMFWLNNDNECIRSMLVNQLIELKLNVKETISKVSKALKSVVFSGARYSLETTNLTQEIKDIILSMKYTDAYCVCQNLLDLDRAINNQVIESIREHFGTRNLRVKMIGNYYGCLLYEVADGDVEDFKEFIASDVIDLGNNHISINIDKIIK